MEYGTNIVGGVKPGVEGEHLGLPIVPSVRAVGHPLRIEIYPIDLQLEAAEILRPNASAIYVPGNGTAKAIEEAIEAEIPLVVAVAEHIPIHDILKVLRILRYSHGLADWLRCTKCYRLNRRLALSVPMHQE